MPFREVTPRNDYSIPDNRALELAVTNVIKRGVPGIIRPDQFPPLSKNIDRKLVVAGMKTGITPEDFEGTLKLSYGTEVPTHIYGDIFIKSGQEYDQPWLAGFTRDLWVPDEATHATPFGNILR